MPVKSSYPSLQGAHAFLVTPSDTVDIRSDAANVEGASSVYLHNIDTGATVRVLPAGEHGSSAVPVTIFLPQGVVFPLAVRRVYATTPTPPSGLVAIYGKSGS
jgi:hypothetical protein